MSGNSYSQNNKVFVATASDLMTMDGLPNDSGQYYGLFQKGQKYEHQQEFNIRKIKLKTYVKDVGVIDYNKVKGDSLILIFAGIKFKSENIYGLIPGSKGFGTFVPRSISGLW